MRATIHLMACLSCALGSWIANAQAPPAAEVLAAAAAPAPLYRDPLFDGAADPVLVWHPQRQAWWMLYTQRRAMAHERGVAWCHGCEIGVAESRDGGNTWNYVGQLPLTHPDQGYSFWAPDVIRTDDGVFHLFVTYVPGAASTHEGWGGERYIFHYTSRDLWSWDYQKRIPTTSNFCIDPSICRRPDGKWRMWFKDEGQRSATLALESSDLETWQPIDDPGVSKLYGEAPKVFHFGGSYWMLKDPNSGLDVYKSADLSKWTYQGKILKEPGTRVDDGSIGKHADVVVCGKRAFIVYFTHPYGQDYPDRDGYMPLPAKRSSIQGAELEVRDGKLVCDRNKGGRLALTPTSEETTAEPMPTDGSHLAPPPTQPEVAPAPLYRDSLFDGAADPVLVWHPQRQAWWMIYTQRRAMVHERGVAWCHGTELGVAESRDGGNTWSYVGQLPLSHPDDGYSFWAPDLIRAADGTYHLFVSYVPGPASAHVGWNGDAYIFHYRGGDDLWNWEFVRRIPTDSDQCIDPTVYPHPDGKWRMWYKDSERNSDTLALESSDLENWQPIDDPGVSKLSGEAPKVFEFGGSYWMLKDPNSGLDVYKSADLNSWTYQGKILQEPGTRVDDGSIGKHADVVVCGERAFIFYFTHPYGQDYPERDGYMPLPAKRSSIQGAELEVRDGKLVCDRNKGGRLALTAPAR